MNYQKNRHKYCKSEEARLLRRIGQLPNRGDKVQRALERDYHDACNETDRRWNKYVKASRAFEQHGKYNRVWVE